MTLGLAILSCALAAGACHPSGAPGAYAAAVRVTGAAGSTVELRALDVPRGRLASFCTTRICSPHRVAVRLTGGTATVGINVIPTVERAAPLHELHVVATAAGARAGTREAVR